MNSTITQRIYFREIGDAPDWNQCAEGDFDEAMGHIANLLEMSIFHSYPLEQLTASEVAKTTGANVDSGEWQRAIMLFASEGEIRRAVEVLRPY